MAVIASNFSKFNEPFNTLSIIPASSETGINAPLKPPTCEQAITPPFLTASFKSANAAVVPCVPTLSSPISSKICATESPIAGVGAKDKSTIPKGILSLLDASFPTSCPILVILKAVFLIVSATISKGSFLTFSNAF